jgi:hypothetical protein
VDFTPSFYNRISDDSYISPSMKTLHTVSAVIELGAGLALLVFPSAVVNLLLGSPLDASAAVALGRLTGAALFALGGACWLARGDTLGCAARGLVVAMLIYNVGAVVVLGLAGVQLPTTGIALWPAVVLHGGMAIWCVYVLVQSEKNVPH